VIDLLLTGGTVVTIDQQRRILRDGAVAIDGGRIVAVGPSADLVGQFPARKTVDCKAKRSCPA
jgi:predicted amidohydrolase YtcJ